MGLLGEGGLGNKDQECSGRREGQKRGGCQKAMFTCSSTPNASKDRDIGRKRSLYGASSKMQGREIDKKKGGTVNLEQVQSIKSFLGRSAQRVERRREGKIETKIFFGSPPSPPEKTGGLGGNNELEYPPASSQKGNRNPERKIILSQKKIIKFIEKNGEQKEARKGRSNY